MPDVVCEICKVAMTRKKGRGEMVLVAYGYDEYGEPNHWKYCCVKHEGVLDNMDAEQTEMWKEEC